eukprot:Partr_v1_DN28838_c0_g1_i2_m33784 putative TatD DNase domain containing
MKFFDAHSHPQESTVDLRGCMDRLFQSHVTSRICVMGTRPSDWQLVEDLHSWFPQNVVPCFGLHPWFAYEAHESFHPSIGGSWKEELRRLLVEYPNAIVGEFGLDKVAVTPGDICSRYPLVPESTYDSLQTPLFEAQFDIASELRRPVSLHVVKCHGWFLNFIHERVKRKLPMPPAIMMHSFSGSVDIIRQLSRMRGCRFFFSFSSLINGRSPGRLSDSIKAVADDRLLLESDHGDAARIDQAMDEICSIVSDAKSWTRKEVEETCWANMESFSQV